MQYTQSQVNSSIHSQSADTSSTCSASTRNHDIGIPQWFEGSDNTHAVARAIAQHRPISRIQLTHMLGLSQGALSRITGDLLHENVIEEVGTEYAAETNEHRGRPQTGLQLRTDQFTCIGANIHSQEIVMTQVDAQCRAIGESISEPLHSYAPDVVAQQIGAMTSALLARPSAQTAPPVVALGVSLGGHHIENRYVRYAPFMRWNGNIDFGAMVHAATGLPCGIYNDIDSLLLKEGWFGAASGLQSYAVVTLGAGVGYSLAVEGKAVDYPDKSFGLLGHIPLDSTGPRCSSGHVGCSSILTNDSITAEYSTEIGHAVTYQQFEHDAAAFVPAAVRLSGRTAHRLGTLLAMIANVAMPQKILVSGEGSPIVAMNIEDVRTGITQYRHSQAQPVDFEILDFSWTNWALAAGARAIAQYIG